LWLRCHGGSRLRTLLLLTYNSALPACKIEQIGYSMTGAKQLQTECGLEESINETLLGILQRPKHYLVARARAASVRGSAFFARPSGPAVLSSQQWCGRRPGR